MSLHTYGVHVLCIYEARQVLMLGRAIIYDLALYGGPHNTMSLRSVIVK